ncbi:uncharacterized protein LOC111359834 [Spodoptera litura]|uniref:Uncharacterized protein LOC111359834 n=1 Tax=Spodoptera litura TaxID=69820 RepID=A0A9J7EIF5_SPOLT|nr:uncharacterized protein LOC111359834 [Spodoptera litura]
MPKRCTLGCEHGVGTHRFPNPRKFLNKFRKWVLISGGDPDDPIDYERYQKCIMCDKHFDAKDRTRYNRLSCLAIPCLNLPPSAAKIFEEIKRNDDNGDGDTEMNDTEPDPCDSVLFETDTPEIQSEFEVQENLEGEFISKGQSDPEGQSEPEGQLTSVALSEPAEIETSVKELTPVVLSKPTGQLKPVILTNIKGQFMPIGQLKPAGLSTPVVLSKPVGQLKPVVLSNSGHSKPAGQLTPALSNHNGQLMPVGELRPAIKLKSLGHLHPAGKFIPVGQLKPIIKLTPIAQTPVGKAKRHIHCVGSHGKCINFVIKFLLFGNIFICIMIPNSGDYPSHKYSLKRPLLTKDLISYG